MHPDFSPPLVSHVFICFAPPSRLSYKRLAMKAAAATSNGPGWVYVVCNREDIRGVHDIMEELDIPIKDFALTSTLKKEDPEEIARLVKPYAPWSLDPQEVTRQLWHHRSDNATLAHPVDLEYWSTFARYRNRDFQLIDYTPASMQRMVRKNSITLRRVIQKDPQVAVAMQKDGLLTSTLTPTDKLRSLLSERQRPF